MCGVVRTRHSCMLGDETSLYKTDAVSCPSEVTGRFTTAAARHVRGKKRTLPKQTLFTADKPSPPCLFTYKAVTGNDISGKPWASVKQTKKVSSLDRLELEI